MESILDLISEMQEDSAMPKNVREKLNGVAAILQQEAESSIKINKALQALDELMNDNNIEQFTRTQLWNIVSLLEKI